MAYRMQNRQLHVRSRPVVKAGYCRFALHGFSLVELSIVLVIVGLLTSAAVVPLSSTYRHARYKQSQLQLQSIREAMHGYLVTTGRLPCPLANTTTHSGNSLQGEYCRVEQGGLPAVELGLMGERSKAGALLDAWGREFHYAVSLADHDTRGSANTPDWLTTGEPATVGAGQLVADLQLCHTNVSAACPQRALIADQIVWVILSYGESNSGTGTETENQDNDRVYVHSPFSTNAEQPFDDQIIWASRSELVYWLLKANWLP